MADQRMKALIECNDSVLWCDAVHGVAEPFRHGVSARGLIGSTVRGRLPDNHALLIRTMYLAQVAIGSMMYFPYTLRM